LYRKQLNNKSRCARCQAGKSWCFGFGYKRIHEKEQIGHGEDCPPAKYPKPKPKRVHARIATAMFEVALSYKTWQWVFATKAEVPTWFQRSLLSGSDVGVSRADWQLGREPTYKHFQYYTYRNCIATHMFQL